MTKPDGNEFTAQEIQRGTGITPSYIGRLRSGQANNPTLKVIRALACFFDVPSSYFIDDVASAHATLQQTITSATLIQDEFELEFMKRVLPIIRDLRQKYPLSM